MRIDVVREERGKLLVDAIRNEVVSAQRVADDLVARRRSAASFAVAISFAVIVLFVIVAGSIALRAQRQSQHQQRLLQLQIEERNAALERSNAALQEFAYVASHDLQEPLRTVASFTELLRERYSNELDAVANEFIDFAVDGARRMRLLIDDILSYSRVTTHGKPLENADLRESVMRAIENLKLAIDERSADVRVGEMPSVLGDKAQLAQLFQNLIGNALKYGGNPPQVAVSARRDGEVWRVCVADNGIGIAPEHHQRVFRMFQRLHTREEYSGTGVGLAICRGIVERHGGRIWVESNTGAGATFCFTLHGAS
jgi:light-regulated signal transduction histidine kinase (bacteriophytochrome)